MASRRYRVCTSLRGVCTVGESKGIVAVPAGAIVTLVGDHEQSAIYATVQWNSLELLVFPQDLLERTVECGTPRKRVVQ